MHKKPILSNIKNIATTQFFNIQSMDVAFSNGEKRQYERLKSTGNGAVLVVPMLSDDTVLMIYEYSGGTDKYELALTKGKIDEGESPFEAANRELTEEIGYGANHLELIKVMSIAPGYQSSLTHIILATDLYQKRTQGDEPEPLRVVERQLSDLKNWVQDEDLTEARSIAALYMVKDRFQI
jgi:ADP-ribose diphosphatase